jgi:anti-anti-sigma regulatory factor
VPTLKPAAESAPEPVIADRGAVGPQTASITPGATIEVRHVDAADGVIITMTGVIGRNDAAILSKQLHTELDAAPTVVVVNLSQVHSCDPTGREVLATARGRAQAAGIALHVIAPSDLMADNQLAVTDPARRATEDLQTDR